MEYQSQIINGLYFKLLNAEIGVKGNLKIQKGKTTHIHHLQAISNGFLQCLMITIGNSSKRREGIFLILW